MSDEIKKNNAYEKALNAQIGGNDEYFESEKSPKELKREERERKLAERERINKQFRLKKAREKIQRQIERDKLKAEAIKNRERKRAELEEKKLQIKEQKMLAKEERASKKQDYKQKSGRFFKNGGLVTAVVCLGITTTLLGSALLYMFLSPSDTANALETSYRQSFYSAVKQVDNMDVNMSKFLATNDLGAKQLYLMDIAINSEICESDIGKLPLQDENKYYTTKLVNQIGDYSKYINKKIINGGDITEEDNKNFYSLYKANKTLKQSLQNTIGEMENDYSFNSMLDGGENIVLDNFNELQNLSVSYPELIYDGPFSDGISEREIKGISGAKISSAEAVEIYKTVFYDKDIENIMIDGESNGNIPCYAVSGELEGEICYAQISKTGGKLIMFSYSGSCALTNYQSDYAIEKGKDFLNKLGVNNMQEVWYNLADNVYTINFAYSTNNVIVYSDLIKIRVCAETGDVIGIEATSYYTNHTERVIASPALTKSQASAYVNDGIDLETCRLCIVPIGNTAEKLCYEFSGSYDDSVYYVYIDAITGRQVEMFKVIESSEGQLLI